MSQENSNTEKTQETRKKILLGALLVVLLGVLYYQFFWESDTPVTTTTAAPVKNTTDSVKTPVVAARPAPRPGETPEQIISQPLDLASMSGKTVQDAGTGRNIFVYPPPPPPPTPKPIPPPPPPPEPPIKVSSVNPAGVIARTGDFSLTVFGDKIPQDAQGFVDGREYPTTFVSATEIKIKVPATAIRTPGNLGVMIRSKTDAALYSNQHSLNVAEPPSPQYRYVGLIINKNGAMAVLKSQSDDEIINVRKNTTFGEGRWRVVNITPQKIEIEDTKLKLDAPHTIFFTGENG
jgi:hypothetical protein